MKIKYYLSAALLSSVLCFQSCSDEQVDLESDKIELGETLSERRGLTANFTPSVRIFNNQASVSFINRSRFASTFEWSFEGASIESSVLRNPTATYSQNGTFDVTLTSTRRGKSETITRQVVIEGLEGIGNIDQNVEEEADVQVSARFFASVRIVNNQAQVTINNRSENAESFQWSFPGGTPETSTEENPVITYPRNGVFTITLVAANGDVNDTTVQNITINNIPDATIDADETGGDEVDAPEAVDVRARFFVSVRRINGESVVTMNNRSTNATSFQWSFPGANPATSTEQNPTVTYTERGVQTITLVATNGDVSDTRTVNITL